MCNPALIQMGIAVVGAIGQQQAGAAAKKAAEANAKIQTIMADDALARGKIEEASQRRKTAAFKGRQAAAFGASGAEINTGSSADILADTAALGELDVLRIRSNAEREAFAHLSAAAIGTSAGINAQRTANVSSFGTILSGAGKVSSQWNVFKADNPGSSFGNFLGFGNSPAAATVT